MAIVSLRRKAAIIVAFVVLLFVTVQLLQLLCTLGRTFNVYLYNTGQKTGSMRFVYSNALIFDAIRAIRSINCELHSNHVMLKNACQLTRSANVSGKVWSKRLPGCIIIGTYKSGTRELIDFLYMNPQVVIRREPVYEVDYFDKNVDKGLEWYRDEMPLSLPGQVTVEKSPGYFYSDQTPRRIHDMNSSIKLILMVREPVERAFSEFSFAEYVAQKRYGGAFYNCAVDPWTKEVNRNCFAIRHSVYDAPFSRFLQFFNRSQILVIDAAEFRRNPYNILRKVEEHLGIDHVIREDSFIYNPDKDAYCIRNISATKTSLCYDITRGRTSYQLNITNAVKRKLNSWFRAHSEQFFTLTGRRFSWT